MAVFRCAQGSACVRKCEGSMCFVHSRRRRGRHGGRTPRIMHNCMQRVAVCRQHRVGHVWGRGPPGQGQGLGCGMMVKGEGRDGGGEG